MNKWLIAALALGSVGAVACKSQETKHEVADAKKVSLVVSGMT